MNTGFFMVTSGTGFQANETAIKFARKYHHALAKDGTNATGATELIAFINDFHVRTLGALSPTSELYYITPFEP